MKIRAAYLFIVGLIVGACNGSHARTPAASASTSPEHTDAPAAAVAAPISPQPSASSVATAASASATGMHTWSFDGDKTDTLPPGFSFGRTGGGPPGLWLVRADTAAPSGANVLAQLNADDTDYRFPIAVADEPLLRDVSVSVRCKPVSGKVDQACGLVFRYRDPDNYYVTRANALENNVRLYHVVKGNRQQFAGWNGTVLTGHWHSLRAQVNGAHFEVYWDDRKVIDARDTTFTEPGRVGVWTKADSVTYFDDLKVSPN